MWKIYDELIAAVPADLHVTGCLIGLHWTLVRSRAVGMALTPFDSHDAIGVHGVSAVSGIGEKVAGMSLRRLAEYVKSWNPFEATLGLAAINSVLNSPEEIEKLLGRPPEGGERNSAFIYYAKRLRGKKVTVVGRFPGLEPLAELCDLTVLERRPGAGDLPDAACEYVLPSQDFVFITATALINKTLPRLLELSHNAFTVLVGPSTPLTPMLFDHGVNDLAGTVVADPASVWQAVQEGATRNVFDHGALMVKVSGDEVLRARQ